jgi:Rab proteins geranylgeranyltransferase component A
MTSSADKENYDLVIEGTGLTESLLAAAASWTGKRVLHIDENSFYGSHWAAVSIDQVDTWIQDKSDIGTIPLFILAKPFCLEDALYHFATLKRLPISTFSHPSRLQASRAYSLDLSPHLLYCSSDLVSCLAKTKLSQYLEFKALEHIFIFQRDANDSLTLQKVPSSREDVFTSSLSLQEKRKLMKFLNYTLSLTSTGSSAFTSVLI